LADAEKHLLRRVSLRVSSSDDMYERGWPTSYLTAGVSATRSIQAALDAAGKVISEGAILDFPCGYGRVLRFLKRMFPDATVIASDISTDMVEFCQRAFGVQGYPSNSARSLKSLSLPSKFDLIWCGSLMTHLDERAAVELLGFFCRHLKPGGLCVFTTHGQPVAEMFERKELFVMTEPGRQKALSEYRQRGYGYTDYPWTSSDGPSAGLFGLSLSSQSRVVELARSVGSWEDVYYRESGWHQLQDVHAFRLPDLPRANAS
jgi:SAM-dependent methyltransferase